jgi:hypothetical protein
MDPHERTDGREYWDDVGDLSSSSSSHVVSSIPDVLCHLKWSNSISLPQSEESSDDA